MIKNKYIISAVGVLVGLIMGYSYYYFIDCESGSCAITSKPFNSTLYGGMMGGLLFNMFVSSKKDQQK